MSRKTRVALFVTCLVNQVLPDVGVATVRLLRRAGFEVDFPMDQTCCGQPFFNSGFRTQARDLARRTIEVLEPYAAVVLPGGSCTTMLRNEYPHLFDHEPGWAERATQLAGKTFELSEFLVHQAAWAPPRRDGAPHVTYHDSCHMLRGLGLRSEPRQLLEAVGCTIHEMTESDRCCGFGGVFSIRMPEVSNAMTADKLRQATETGTSILVTSDPGCLMQMRGMLKSDSGLRAAHLATILDEVTR